MTDNEAPDFARLRSAIANATIDNNEPQLAESRLKTRQALQTTLQSFSSILLDPLSYWQTNGPLESAKTELSSGKVKIGNTVNTATAEFIAQALEVSRILKLNEMSSAVLLKRALDQESRFTDMKLSEIASEIYFQDRYSLLYSLLEVVRSPLRDIGAKDIIAETRNSLLTRGLVKNIYKTLDADKFRLDYPSLPPRHQELCAIERVLLAETLFCIFYQSTASPADYEAVFKLYRDSLPLPSQLKTASQSIKTRLVQVNDTLLLTLFTMLSAEEHVFDVASRDNKSQPVATDMMVLRSVNQKVSIVRISEGN